jgi:hypothetical protein
LPGISDLGLLVDLAELAPQFRSVHYKDIRAEGENTEPQESSVSIIASLRAADATVYRHESRTLEIPDVSSLRKDLAHISLQNADIKIRRGRRVFGAVSLGDIEGSINAHEMTKISRSIQHWVSQVNVLASTIQTISQQRLCKSRNLVAAIVVAGDKYGITNDPPFLTRPSHVLRISKNLLRVDDSWKISVRVRHISRSLPTEARDKIEKMFFMSTTCSLDSMRPVTDILSRWRAWEMSNIQESFFVKWLYGEPDGKVKVAEAPIEGVVVLEKIVLYLDANDGNENALSVINAVVSCNEHQQRSESGETVIGVEIDCKNMALNATTNVLDLMGIINPPSTGIHAVVETTKPIVATPDASTLQYRATIHLSHVDFSASAASLAVTSAVHDLRASGFSQLRPDEPSICLSFQQAGFTVLEGLKAQQFAAHLNLEHFTAQMISNNQRPGIAASLGTFVLRLPKSMPWLVTQVGEALYAIKQSLNVSPDTSLQSAFEKPDIPTVAFRLHHASIETWLVPDALQVNLESGGFQVVLGELSSNKQWGFFDVPPATISFYRIGVQNVKFAAIETPFIAAKARVQWDEGLCKVDPDVLVGKLSVSLTSLVTLFQTLASEEVIKYFSDCRKAVEHAQIRLPEPVPTQPRELDEITPFISYRVHALWEAVEIKEDTPETKLLFACTGIKLSLSNRSVKKSSQNQRILFTAGSKSTSIALYPSEDPDDKLSILDMQWEVGNSINTDDKGHVQYRMYLISNAILVTLCPRSISQASRALRHIVQEIDSLQIRQTFKDLDIGPRRPWSRNGEPETIDDPAEPLQMLKDVDALRVSFSNVRFIWLADDRLNDSQGFTFKCKTVDASVLEGATRGRFVIQEGEMELSCRKTKVSNNYARLPKLDFNVHRRTAVDGWQLQLDAHGDTVQVNFTPACVETGRAVLESISTAAAILRSNFPSDNTAPANPLSTHALLQTQKLKAVVTSIDFHGARINAQYDPDFKQTGYMSKYQVKGDRCSVGSMQIPGLALRSRFSRKPRHVFHAEICILESSNVLSPQIIPFLHEILHRIELVMSRRTIRLSEASSQSSPASTAAILGDLKFSVGLRVQSQELTLTCDPFAKVDASIGVDEVYATLISCKTASHDQTFATTVTVSGAHASLQHHYSGIASAKIKLNDLNLSMFNNNQIRTTEPGISAILKSSALEVSLNARQGMVLKYPLTHRTRLFDFQ